MNISLRQMRAFAETCNKGSFTLAAAELHLSQSAVSMLVRQLESEMNLTLFNRGRTTLTITEAGRQLLPLVQGILRDLQHVKDGATDLRNLKRGSLRLVVSQMLACAWLPPVLAAFRARYPDIELTLTDASTDGVVDVVRSGDVDIGLGPQRPTGDDIAATPFLDVSICLVCPLDHRLARRRNATWEDTREDRWVVYSNEFFRQLEDTLHAQQKAMTFQVATQVTYLTTALALVGSGMGVTAAPLYVRTLAPHFNVHFVALREPVVERSFHVYHRARDALSPAVAAFMALLREQPGMAPVPAGRQRSSVLHQQS